MDGFFNNALLTQVVIFLMTVAFFVCSQQEEDNECGCSNVMPPNSYPYPCWLQKYQGSCYQQWIMEEGYCDYSCGRCVCVGDCACSNIPPPDEHSCLQLVQKLKCEQIREDYCQHSCGRCPCYDKVAVSSPNFTMPTLVPPLILIQNNSSPGYNKTDNLYLSPNEASMPQQEIEYRQGQYLPDKQLSRQINNQTSYTVDSYVPQQFNQQLLFVEYNKTSESSIEQESMSALNDRYNRNQSQDSTIAGKIGLQKNSSSSSDMSQVYRTMQDGNQTQHTFVLGASGSDMNYMNTSVSYIDDQQNTYIVGAYGQNKNRTNSYDTLQSYTGVETYNLGNSSVQLQQDQEIEKVSESEDDVVGSHNLLASIGSMLGQLENALHYDDDVPVEGKTSISQTSSQSESTSITDLKCVTSLLEELAQTTCKIAFDAVIKTGLDFALNDPAGSYTFFVPTDKAFERAKELGLNITEEMELEDDILLTHLLGYHILQSSITVNLLRKQPEWKTLYNGQMIFVSNTTDHRVQISGHFGNSARILQSDIQVEHVLCSSIIHTIDQVLLPQGLVPTRDPYTLLPVSILHRGVSPTLGLVQRLQSINNFESFETTPIEADPTFQTNQEMLKCSQPFTRVLDFESQVLSPQSEISEFWKLIKKFASDKLLSILEDTITAHNVTIFAPLNSVIQGQNLDINNSSIRSDDVQVAIDKFISSHFVISDVWRETDLRKLPFGQVVSTLGDDQQLFIVPDEPYAMIMGEYEVVSTVQAVDIIQGSDIGCNVAVHGIDRMLANSTVIHKLFGYEIHTSSPKISNSTLPPMYLQQLKCLANQSLKEALEQNKKLQYAADFFQQWASQDLLQEQGSMTVFVPTEQQIGKLLELSMSLQNKLQTAEEVMYDLLDYHVVMDVIIEPLDMNEKKWWNTRINHNLLIGKIESGFLIGSFGSSALVVEEKLGRSSCSIQFYIIDDILYPVSSAGSRYVSYSTVEEPEDMFEQVSFYGLESFIEAPCDGENIEVPLLVEEAQNCAIKFKDLFDKYSLQEGIENVTVLIPNNEACNQLDSILESVELECDKQSMEVSILAYHIVQGGEYLSDETFQGLNSQLATLQTLLEDTYVSVQRAFGNVYFGGALGQGRIQLGNIQDSSCSTPIHIIDKLLLPFESPPSEQDCGNLQVQLVPKNSGPIVSRSARIPITPTSPFSQPTYVLTSPQLPPNQLPLLPSPQPSPLLSTRCQLSCCTLFELISQRTDITVFANMIQQLNLTEYLRTQIDMTLFAPNNLGLSQYLDLNITSDLTQENMYGLMLYHMVEGVWPTSLMNSQQFQLTTKFVLENGNQTYLHVFSEDEGLFFMQRNNWTVVSQSTNASIIENDVEGCSTMMHIIDTPLIYEKG